MLSVVLFIVLCLVTTYLWWIKHNNGPPAHPGALPVIGNAHQFIGDSMRLWQFIKEMAFFSLKSGGVSTIFLGPIHRIYIITDPDDCLTLSNACFDRPFVYDIAKEWTANGLITAEVSIWKPHRKLLNPMFKQQMLNANLEVFNKQARILVNNMSAVLGKGQFNTRNYVVFNAQDTIFQILLGLTDYDKNEAMIKKYCQATQDMLEIFIAKTQKLWLHIPFIYQRSEYKNMLEKAIGTAVGITTKVIQNRKEELLKDEIALNKMETDDSETFLDYMLKLAINQNAFTDEEIRQHLENLIFTGYDTVSETLIFALKLIASDQRVQNCIYEELQNVLGDKSVDVRRYDLVKLVYLEAVIKETLRMNPTVPLVARSVLKDVQLKNHTLRAGSIGAISVIGINRHPIWGTDVEDFRPERWLDGSLPDNPSLFASFSLGKRNCIGKWYAIISLKTTLSHILRNYRITTDDAKISVKYDVSIRAHDGHEITIEERK